MYVRNLLKSGDYVELVPVGLPITLQYGDTGDLEKIFYGFDEPVEDISTQIIDAFRSNRPAPLRIPIQNGTTYIRGILYTSKQFTSQGFLPECIKSDIITDYVEHGDEYNFFGAHIESYAMQFSSSTQIRQWFQFNKFNLLPGLLITSDSSREKFYKMVQRLNIPFKFPLINYLHIYNTDGSRFVNTELRQIVSKKVSKKLTLSGCILGEIELQDSDDTLTVNYSDIVNYRIAKNVVVIQDQSGKIIYSCDLKGNTPKKVPEDIECEVCGKIIPVPHHGLVTCDDPHCPSLLYDRIEHFTKILNLPRLKPEDFELHKGHGLTCLSDLLIIPPWDSLTISAPLSDILRAVITYEEVSDTDMIHVLVNNCNNSWSSVLFYLQHPDRMKLDFQFEGISYRQLYNWCIDPYNLLQLTTIIESPQFNITSGDRKFDGPPIFRGKSIYLTGKFEHGDYGEIESIIKSYSGEVSPQFTEDVNCVVVGNIPEGVNGGVIRTCQNLGIPVMTESDFFITYDIDADLMMNLQ